MDKLAQALQTKYGIRLIRAERIDYGIWEENFMAWTDRGQLFVKRFWRKDRLQKPERMIRGLELGEWMRERGFPVPMLVRSKRGELLAEADGTCLQVNEWVDGRSFHPGELPLREANRMGELLGKFHRSFAADFVPPRSPYHSPGEALAKCNNLLQRFSAVQDQSENDFPAFAADVLREQIALLEGLPADLGWRLPSPTLGGVCFGSYWVEQLLFKPDGQVAALVDWTDGAGESGHWAGDIVTGLHLSALGEDGIRTFCAGYQIEHPLPPSEWKAIAAMLCYGQLADTNFLEGWLNRSYRDMAHWERISAAWLRRVPGRFRRWQEIEAMLMGL
jgi:Ser/Thr protein kinase RdoA (MazF antagonist)